MPKYFKNIRTVDYSDEDHVLRAAKLHTERLNNYIAGYGTWTNEELGKLINQPDPTPRNLIDQEFEVLHIDQKVYFISIVCCDDDYGNY